MSKFKVGDRVRLVADNDGFGLVGDTGSIAKPDCGSGDARVRFDVERKGDHEWYASWDKLQHIYTFCAAAEVDNLADEYGGARKVEFKKGDRIRVIKLGEGGSYHLAKIGAEFTVTEVEDCFGETEIHTDGKWYFYPSEIEHAAPATLRIEAGKFYKTRDGRKALVSVNNLYDQDAYPFYHEVDGKSWHAITNDGKSCIGYDHCDLIAEWTDEPVVAAPKAKFKVGDKVGCTTNRRATYVIKGANGDRVDVSYIMDSGEEASHIYRDQDAGIFFVKPTTIADIVARHSQSGTAIVAVLENGQPRPATRPYVHGSTHLAETEANRLARANPGKEFGVYTLGAVAKVERVYEHEWQRRAMSGDFCGAKRILRDTSGITNTEASAAVLSFKKRAA